MAIQVRKSEDRGHVDHGWLNTYHTFSFSDYYDPKHTHFRSLRVINEDKVQPGDGFDTHPHNDMEIITYVLEGALAHKDSMGNGSTIKPGEVQRMTAGTGITHSEFNHSKEDWVHLLQIWILPNKIGLKPSYEQKHFDNSLKDGKLCLLASSNGQNGSVTIHQDVKLYATRLKEGESVDLNLEPGRQAWIQVARGSASVNDTPLEQGDGASLTNEKKRLQIARA